MDVLWEHDKYHNPATIIHIFSILVCKRQGRTGPGSNLPQQKCDAAEGAFVAFASHSKPTGCRLTAAGTRRKLYKCNYYLYLQSFENIFSKLSPAGQPTSQPLLLQATVVPMVHSALPGPMTQPTLLCLGLEAHCSVHIAQLRPRSMSSQAEAAGFLWPELVDWGARPGWRNIAKGLLLSEALLWVTNRGN